MPKKILTGTVMHARCEKTISVKVFTTKAHPLYKKVMNVFKKYAVHNPEDRSFKPGDVVKIIESRPISKTKRWCVVYEDGAVS